MIKYNIKEYKNYCSKFDCKYSYYYSELKKINCKCNNNLSSFSINEDFNINNNSFKNDSIISTNITVITCYKNLNILDIIYHKIIFLIFFMVIIFILIIFWI